MLEESKVGHGPPSPGWMCSFFLEPAWTCPFSWYPGSQVPAALAYTRSTYKQLGVAGMLCPLTRFETLGAAKEPSSGSSFSSFPPLQAEGPGCPQGLSPIPSPPPGWPRVLVHVQKPRARGDLQNPNPASTQLWETV